MNLVFQFFKKCDFTPPLHLKLIFIDKLYHCKIDKRLNLYYNFSIYI